MDMSKLPHTLEVGWYAYNRCPSTMDKEERRRITFKSLDDCLRGDGMSELCRAMADMTLGNYKENVVQKGMQSASVV